MSLIIPLLSFIVRPFLSHIRHHIYLELSLIYLICQMINGLKNTNAKNMKYILYNTYFNDQSTNVNEAQLISKVGEYYMPTCVLYVYICMSTDMHVHTHCYVHIWYT